PHRRAREVGDESRAASHRGAHAGPDGDRPHGSGPGLALPVRPRSGGAPGGLARPLHPAKRPCPGPARPRGEGPGDAPRDREPALAHGPEQGSDGVPHGDPEQMTAPLAALAFAPACALWALPALASPPPRLVHTPVETKAVA